MTVLEVIQKSTEYLSKRGVESPRLQSELLLASVLQVPRLRLYLEFERVPQESQLDQLRDLVRRRGNREPLQHLVGSVSFCGLEIEVDRRALIPRPETELLAERACAYLKALGGGTEPGSTAVPESEQGPVALDWGTGTGCLAISMGVQAPFAHIWATDLSSEALGLARKNAREHGVEKRIEFCCGDGFTTLPPGLRLDLIVSNPPYIPTAEIATLEPEVRDYDPRLALDGGEDGLRSYRCLSAEAGRWLRPGGRLMVEIGDGQEGTVAGLFAHSGGRVEEIVRDYSSCPRIIIARWD